MGGGQIFYWLFKRTVLAFLRLWFRPTIEGLNNVPPGAAILACNHQSFSDSFFLGAVISRHLTFLAKSSYFTTRGGRGWLMARFFAALGQVPVDRSGGPAGETALAAGVDVLRRGDLLGIYPEGTRSPDGRLYRGRTGMARLALATGAPVVPVAMIGTEQIQPPGSLFLRRKPLHIRIGEPMDFSHQDGQDDEQQLPRAMTNAVMAELARLSGQQYVDSYSPGPQGRGRRPSGQQG